MFFRCRLRSLAEETFSAVMGVSNYGQVVFDCRGKLVQINTLARRQYCSFAGCSGSECGSDRCSRGDFFNFLYDHAVDDNETVTNTIMRDADAKYDLPAFREVIRCGDAGLRLVNAYATQNGMTIFNMIDITAEERREKQLKHLDMLSYQLLHAVQATSTGIVISDPKQEGHPVLFANDAFCTLSGLLSEEVMVKGWDSLSHFFPDDHEHMRFLNALEECSSAEFELEDSPVLQDGNTRYYSLLVSPVYHDGDLDLFIGLVSDVTLLKQREVEVFRAQKLESLGGLAAGVAHDFNNILSIITGYSAMLSKSLADCGVKEGEYVQNIERAAKRGADLTQKMLTFSSCQVVDKTVLNICAVVAEQSDFLDPLLGADVKLDVVMPENECKCGVYVRGRKSSIEQILMNLSINARDAMPEGGNIRIVQSCVEKEDVSPCISKEIKDESGLVCLSVTDDGLGMEPSVAKRIFDPFFTTKEPGKGTGLGLSVVYGLTKEMGGHLDVVTNLGHGTTISVYLPRFEGPCVPKSIQGNISEGVETVRLDGYTALVVEDEPDLLNVIARMLEDLGMRVICASDGADALVRQEEYDGQIDVLLTDVIMPEVNGVKLAELFTALRPDSKVIFMSGFPARGDMAPVELPEDAVFIAKPIVYEKLAEMLCYSLSKGCSDTQKYVAQVVEIPCWKSFSEGESEVSSV
ncbi:MAG: ATP-binding protein [Alphaproteobacteria bacterium]